jgi:single-strand DNA-binding protein
MSFQTIIIAGHLGRDPEMRYTPAGQAVTNFNLAANRQYTDLSGQCGGRCEASRKHTWFRVSAWGKTAENCNQYLHKGSPVLVEGRLVCDPETGSPRLYTRQDGSPASSFEVSASTVRFLSGREGENEPEPAGNGSAALQHDDIPF